VGKNPGKIVYTVGGDISTYNIDIYQLEKKITKKTKVIIAVNMYGKPCDLISLKKKLTELTIQLINQKNNFNDFQKNHTTDSGYNLLYFLYN
jgi:hypothetical protein